MGNVTITDALATELADTFDAIRRNPNDAREQAHAQRLATELRLLVSMPAITDPPDFMVSTVEVARRTSVLSGLFLHAFGCLPRDVSAQIMAKARERGGKMDLRIVAEGVDVPFMLADDMVDQAWHRAVRRAAQSWVDRKIDALTEGIREAADGVLDQALADFGTPEDDCP